MAYLITCAGSKLIPQEQNPSELKNLSFNETLFEARQEIIRLSKIQLDWTCTLPAWKLYSGSRSKLYPRISVFNWENPKTDIQILSALFGWIKHTDLLPYYDLRMSHQIGENIKHVWQFWYGQKILNKHIDPKNDIDLLSGDYRKAISGNTNTIAIEPNAHFYDYGVQKGNWLNSQLNNLI